MATIYVACGLALTLASLDDEARARWRWTAPAMLVAAALVATAVQLLPLPVSFLRIVAPGTTDIYALDQLGWQPISLDPPATGASLIHLGALFFAAVFATLVFRHRGRERELLAVIGLYGALLVLIGLGELALLHDEVQHYVTVAFTNPNHFGAFVGFACFANIAVSLSIADGRRWLFAAAAALCLLGVLLSMSRGAIGSLLAVALVYGGLTIARWTTWRAARWVAPLIAACSAAGIWLLWTTIAEELQPDATTLTKLDVWRSSLPMLRDFAFLGIGRGSFPAAFTRYDLTGTQLRFTHVENAPLQALVDYGPIFGSIFVALTGYCLVQVVRGAWQRPDRAAAACGLVFLAIHNLVDFNTTLLGVALPCTLVLTAMYRRERAQRPQQASDRRWMPIAALAATVGVGIVSVPVVRARVSADTAEMRDASARGDVERADALIARHPADWILPAIAAEMEINRDDLKHAMHHINRAMILAPYSDVPHRLAGRALLAAGRRDQARLEYRIAGRKVPGEVQDIITEMLAQGERIEDIPLLANDAPELARPVASVLLDRGAPQLAMEALTSRLAAKDIDAETLDLAARASLDGPDDELTLRLADALEAKDPARPTSYLVRAARAEKRGDFESALAELDKGMSGTSSKRELMQRRIGLLTTLRRFGEAHQAITWVLQHGHGEEDASSAHYYRGNLFLAEGHTAEALGAYRTACDLAPRELSYRLALAHAYESVGNRVAATRELERARSELGNMTAIANELTRLRQATVR